jgi:outer membrane receptor for ferrienterochelin and colicins
MARPRACEANDGDIAGNRRSQQQEVIAERQHTGTLQLPICKHNQGVRVGVTFHATEAIHSANRRIVRECHDVHRHASRMRNRRHHKAVTLPSIDIPYFKPNKNQMMRYLPKRHLLSCLIAAIYAGHATAQTAPATPAPTPVPAPASRPAPATPAAPSKPAEKVDRVEVKGAAEVDERREDTATKIVVTAEEINKFGDTQLADVLKRLPGVTVQGTQVRMRGLGAGYTQFLIDGQRPPPGFTIEQIAPSMIERIEIIRAATAEFSTQSIAGTINIILKQKISFAQREIRANYASGAYYKALSGSFQISDKAGDLAYTVSGWVNKWENSGETKTEERSVDATGRILTDRELVSNNQGDGANAGVAPRLVWTLKGGDTLSWQSFINGWSGDGEADSRYVRALGTPPSLATSRTRYEYSGTSGRSELIYNKKLAEGAKLEVRGSGQFSENENRNEANGFNTTGAQNFFRINQSDSSDRTYAFAGKYTNPIAEGHTFVTGWDFSLSKRDENAEQRDRPFVGVLPTITAFDSNTQFTAEVQKFAVFAQDEWNIDKAWSVYGGLRWEGIKTDVSGNDFASASNRSSVLSPIMQTLYKLPSRKGEQFRLALTRTYKAPNTNQLVPRRFTTIENTQNSPDATGNPDLKPELATGIDVAYEKFWDRGASMSLSGSVRRISDYTRTGLRFINGRWVSLPVNDGRANSRSVEFDAKFPIQTFWKEAPPIDFRYNMNRNWSSVESIPGPNNRLDAQTKFSMTLGLDYRMKGGVFVAGGSFSYRSGGDVRISETQSRVQTAKRDLDVYGLWKITPKVQFRFTLSNVLTPAEVNERAYFDAFGSTVTRTESPSKMNVRAAIELKL